MNKIIKQILLITFLISIYQPSNSSITLQQEKIKASTLSASSIFQNNRDILGNKVLGSISDLYHENKIGDNEIDKILEYLQYLCIRNNEKDLFYKIQALLLFKTNYSYLGEVQKIDILGGGRFPIKPILIETASGKKYVLKFLAFDLEVAKYIVSLNNHLLEKKIPVTEFYKKEIYKNKKNCEAYISSGCSIYKYDDSRNKCISEKNRPCFFSLIEFLDGKIIRGREQTKEHFRNKGRVLAEFINATKDYNLQGKAPTFSYFTENKTTKEIMDKRYIGMLNSDVLQNKLKKQFNKQDIKVEIDFIKTQINTLNKNLVSLLPNLIKAHMHEDLNPGNVLYDNENVVGLIDVGGYSYGYRIFAFKRILLGGSSETTTTAYNVDNLKSAIEGFQEVAKEAGTPLSDYEIQGIIEVLRYDFLNFFILCKNNNKIDSYKAFTNFISNFSTKKQIRRFAKELGVKKQPLLIRVYEFLKEKLSSIKNKIKNKINAISKNVKILLTRKVQVSNYQAISINNNLKIYA